MLFEIIFSKIPSLSHLRVFGCLCFSHNRTNDEFENRSKRYVFLGYLYGKKEWTLYYLETQKTFVSGMLDLLKINFHLLILLLF